jgi:hypothetical protein
MEGNLKVNGTIHCAHYSCQKVDKIKLDKLGHMKDSGNVPVKKPEMNVPRE